MKALPATVLEAEAVAVVSTASAGACTLTSDDAGASCSPAKVTSLARRLAPDGSRGQRVRLASTYVRFSSAIGDGVSFLASQDLLRFCSLKG